MKTIELSISDKNKSLLTHLQENGEFLPAYCAGRGTCGKCKVQFLNNIPAYTTHDAAFFSAKELSEGWRLACQAYIKGQFTIQIEDYKEEQDNHYNIKQRSEVEDYLSFLHFLLLPFLV